MRKNWWQQDTALFMNNERMSAIKPVNTNEKVIISLITVTYNAADTIKRTLDSIAAQECRHFEHIIIDGQSSDGTIALVNTYKANNPHINIKVVSEPDEGLYHAMNKGLKAAEGKYVCFLNAGDSLHDSTSLYNVMKRTEVHQHLPGVIYGETDIVDNKGIFLRHREKKAPEHLSWKSFRQGMLVCHQSFYALREICPEYDTAYRLSADFDWCIRVMKAAKQHKLPLVNTHLVLTDYLAEGMTTKNHKASLKERFRIMAHHYGYPTTFLMHAWFCIKSLLTH
jgi:glycosyltransferase involved in cell wall biosynthesis